MPEYRVYSISADGGIAGPPRIVDCRSDGEAVAEAALLLDGKTLEIWNGARRVAVLGQILKFVPPDTYFDPETTAVLGAAFDEALVALNDTGQPELVKEAMAKRIILLASKGERDPDRLCAAALAALNVQP
jgi:hypothetical protein